MNVIIANQHTATILFPRRGGVNSVAPIQIDPGKSREVPKELWQTLLKGKAVQRYLDLGLIRVTDREKDNIPIMESTGSDLKIPPHLLRDDEEVGGNSTNVTAKVTRKNKSVITI